MTQPITGPFSQTFSATPSFYRRKVAGYKQAKPYDLPLSYNGFSKTRTVGVDLPMTNAFASRGAVPLVLQDIGSGSADPYASVWPIWLGFAQNAAVASFNKKRGEKAAMAVAMAEARESLGMIKKRVQQLFTAANALRKGRFFDVAKTLGLVSTTRPKRSLTRKTKKLRWTKHPVKGVWYAEPKVVSSRRRQQQNFLADHWLEYSFGWAPTVSDIITALKVLDAPLAYQEPVRATGTFTNAYTYVDEPTFYPWKYSYKGTHTLKFSTRIRAVLTVSNPNRDLAQRLGLTNLLSAVVEVIPFSFVANWFFNLDEYITQFDPYYGVSVTSVCYTDRLESSSSYLRTQTYIPTGVTSTVGLDGGNGVSIARTVGSLPAVSYGVRPAYRHSWGRALNQSALLTVLFAPKGKRSFF